jgi:hypothetical protein
MAAAETQIPDDFVIIDGFPEGWGVQERPDGVPAILFCTTGMGRSSICNRPSLMSTDAWLPTARKIANSFAAASSVVPVKGVALNHDGLPALIDDMEFHLKRGFKPLYAAPVIEATVESLSLDADDLQVLLRLVDDNVADGARPVLTKHGPRFEQAERLSRLGLIALEQLGNGVKLHVTKLGTQLARS